MIDTERDAVEEGGDSRVSKFGKTSSAAHSLIVAGIVLALMIAHVASSTDTSLAHAIHMTLRKLFFIPVILAAIWFGLRGSLIACTTITLTYVPFVLVAWRGSFDENVDQFVELIMLWISAIIFGLVVLREKAQQHSLVQAHEGTVKMLVGALDAKEHETQLHSLRVQAYASRLAREFNMSEGALHSLEQGALLHDIGKIGVPDQILRKEGPLDEEEWEKMREHPTIGRKMLERANFLHSSWDVVFSHHEKFDGTGYPQGLRGKEISLGARIFAIVDALDALTSKRPYQDKVDFGDAMQRLQESSGKHFDPEIVEKFASIDPEEWERIAKAIEASQVC